MSVNEVRPSSYLKIGLTAFAVLFAVFKWEVFCGLVSLLAWAIAPLIIGCAIAYAANIIMSFYERHLFAKTENAHLQGIRKPLCLVLALLSLVAVVVLVLLIVVPQVAPAIAAIAQGIPMLIEFLESSPVIMQALPAGLVDGLDSLDWGTIVQSAFNLLQSGVGGTASAVVDALSTAVSWVAAFGMGIVLSIHMLGERDALASQVPRLARAYLPEKMLKKLEHAIPVFDEKFHAFIVGQATEAVILGTLTAAGMFLLGIPYAAMVGVLVAVLAVIPMFGAIIAAIVGALVIITVSPIKALTFLVFFVVLQQIEGNFIYPRVVGNSIGLPGLWVTVAVIVGAALFGIIGILLAVPVCAAAYQLIRDDVAKREAS